MSPSVVTSWKCGNVPDRTAESGAEKPGLLPPHESYSEENDRQAQQIGQVNPVAAGSRDHLVQRSDFDDEHQAAAENQRRA
jgi:hypothetical protein